MYKKNNKKIYYINKSQNLFKKFINLVNTPFSESEKLTPKEKSEGNPYYIGFGNPNAKILFIGKEKRFDIEKNLKQFEFLLNPKEWKNYIVT